MTGGQAFGVLLIILGVTYALMYVGWLPRPHRRASTGPVPGRTAGSRPNQAEAVPGALTLAWAEGTYLSTTVAISRQKRIAAAAGLDVRARANMVVDDSTVRWEREGLDELRIAGPRLLGASLKRGLADTLLGEAQVVLVSWRGDTDKGDNDPGDNDPGDNAKNSADTNSADTNSADTNSADTNSVDTNSADTNSIGDSDQGKGGDRCVTGFLPRSRSDSAALVSAVQRLMQIGGTP